MKFQKLSALEENIRASFPEHLSQIYIVVSSNEAERKKILSSLSDRLEKVCDWKRCQFLKEALAHLSGSSLLSSQVGALFDGIEQLVSSEVELCKHYVKKPNHKGFLVLGASSVKVANALYAVAKKEIVLLDLTTEKPWDEKDRIKRWTVQRFGVEKKKIEPAAVDALVENNPPNRLLLEREIEKLICYVDERPTVTKGDIDTLCTGILAANPFKLATELVFGTSATLPSMCDAAFVLPLIHQLRTHLETGLSMTILLKTGSVEADIQKRFPRLRPRAFSQAISAARQKREAFFANGLKALFALELGIKTSLAPPHILLPIFVAKLQESR